MATKGHKRVLLNVSSLFIYML